MKFKFLDPRNVLKIAGCYRLLQIIGRRARINYVQNFLKAKPGDKILDIGCGPGDILEFLPGVAYVGFDAEPNYIEAAKKKFGERGNFHCALVSEATLPDPGTYDLVNVSGVLHHLSDEEVRKLFSLAQVALKPDGRFVSIDNAFIDGQSFFSKLLVGMDRGEHIRTPDEYTSLAKSFFSEVIFAIRNDLFKPIPYTHIIMNCRGKA
jgi:SAM-dependent methyltransferase